MAHLHNKIMEINKLEKSNLAVRTRGLKWDYDFIVLPVVSDGLYGMHTTLFKDVTPEVTPQNRFIERPIDDKSSLYVIGTCFLIENNYDEFNRPIKYYILYILPKLDKNISEFILPENWGREILEYFNLDKPITSEARDGWLNGFKKLPNNFLVNKNRINKKIVIKNRIKETKNFGRQVSQESPKKNYAIRRIGYAILLLILILILRNFGYELF